MDGFPIAAEPSCCWQDDAAVRNVLCLFDDTCRWERELIHSRDLPPATWPSTLKSRECSSPTASIMSFTIDISPDAILSLDWLTRRVILAAVGILACIGAILALSKLIAFLGASLLASQTKDAYRQAIAPYLGWIGLILLLAAGDVALIELFATETLATETLEILLSFSIAVLTSWTLSQVFKQYFDGYLLELAIASRRKVNSEVFLLARIAANTSAIFVVVFVFAQTHQINLLGLVASLGVGGLAIAFAAQKSLEQLLGGIVLYVDRPFRIDDYIGLPDGTYGRVESIGLRSTKIRTSGRGTLVIVPNNALTQFTIENFTGAKKVISMIYLTFYRQVHQDERALIRQVILGSTRDIFGIDSRSTEISFKDMGEPEKPSITRAQVSLFILGSGSVSLDFRLQLLETAKQNIRRQLQGYGIPFDIDEKTINVDSPITI